jgi:anti-anti-sigma factor
MRYYEKRIEEKPVFYLQGALTGDAPSISLCNRIMELAGDSETEIILEFGDVHKINSQATAMLLSCAMKLRRMGGELCFVKVHPEVRSLFNSEGINTTLPVFDNTDEALNKLVFTHLYV